jgi:hypothetical protein
MGLILIGMSPTIAGVDLSLKTPVLNDRYAKRLGTELTKMKGGKKV